MRQNQKPPETESSRCARVCNTMMRWAQRERRPKHSGSGLPSTYPHSQSGRRKIVHRRLKLSVAMSATTYSGLLLLSVPCSLTYRRQICLYRLSGRIRVAVHAQEDALVFKTTARLPKPHSRPDGHLGRTRPAVQASQRLQRCAPARALRPSGWAFSKILAVVAETLIQRVRALASGG